MPSFYPPTATQYANQSTSHGNGYKDACYQDLSDYSQPYHDFQDARSQDLGSVFPDPHDRFNKFNSAPHSNPYMHPCASGQHELPGVNMMPPMRVGAEQFYAPQPQYPTRRNNMSSHHSHTYAPKEEKPVGGVSATLDYEMEQMADFVAETTFGIYELCASQICIADIDLMRSIRPSFGIPSSFRKWVLQVLHATRLPSATILLSLAYLAQRVRQQTSTGTFDPSEPALYRTLTVAFVLGSKFLDDNTFQNKSWAEVSNIAVGDLNKTEREWLTAFGHRLHQDPECFDGFKSCEQLWKSFQTRTATPAIPAPVLQPINTNLRSQHPSFRPSPANFQQPFNKPASIVDPALLDSQYRGPVYPSYDPWHSHSASPASAQTSGPHTPEYYGGSAIWGTADMYGRQDFSYYPTDSYSATHTPYNKYGSTQFYGYGQPTYPQGQSYWNCHGAACQCGNCRHTHFVPRYGPVSAS